MINFLKAAKAADFLDYEMDLVNEHLERLIISTKSMQDTYRKFGQFINFDATH